MGLDKEHIKNLQEGDRYANFSYRQLTDADAPDVARNIGHGLIKLRLDNNRFTSRSAPVLAAAIKDTSLLALLFIEGNPLLGDEGVSSFMDVVERSPHLCQFYASATGLTSKGLSRVLDVAERHPSLEHIDLRHNKLGSESASMLGDSMAKNALTHKWQLDNTGIGDEGAKAIAGAIRSNANIGAVFLSKNAITDEGVHAITQALKHPHGLHTLNLEENPISQEAKHKLETVIIGSCNPNFGALIGVGDSLAQYAKANVKKLDGLMQKYYPELEKAPPEVWRQLSQRLPLIRSRYNAKTVEMVETFLQSLPELDLSQPLTLEALTKKDKNGRSALDYPATWEHFDTVLDNLNRNGHHLQAEALLDEATQEPNALLQAIIEQGKAPQLFTESNWKGENSRAMKDVLRALPEPVQECIAHHNLACMLNRKWNSPHHSGRSAA